MGRGKMLFLSEMTVISQMSRSATKISRVSSKDRDNRKCHSRSLNLLEMRTINTSFPIKSKR